MSKAMKLPLLGAGWVIWEYTEPTVWLIDDVTGAMHLIRAEMRVGIMCGSEMKRNLSDKRENSWMMENKLEVVIGLLISCARRYLSDRSLAL